MLGALKEDRLWAAFVFGCASLPPENNACACRLFNLRHGLRPARMFAERLLLYHHMMRSARRPHLAVSARHHTGIVPRDSARQDGLIGYP